MGIERVDARSAGFDVWTGRAAHDLDRFFEDTEDRHMLPALASNAAEEDEVEVEVEVAAEDDLPPPMPISCVVSIDNIFDMRPQPVASRPASTKVRVFPVSAEIHTHSSTRRAHTRTGHSCTRRRAPLEASVLTPAQHDCASAATAHRQSLAR